MYTGYEKVLERLLEERLNVGMEQDEIASIIGVTQSNYSKTGRGMRRFSYFQVKRLCETNMDINYIFTGEKSTGHYNIEQYSYTELRAIMDMVVDMLLFEFSDNNERIMRHNLRCIKYFNIFNKHPYTNMKILRDIQGITQENMACEVGVDIKKYRMLEKGKSDPDSELIWMAYNDYGIAPGIILKDKKALAGYVKCILDELNSIGLIKLNKFFSIIEQ